MARRDSICDFYSDNSRLKYGMSIDEIAIVCGVSRQRVSQAIKSGLKKLRAMAEKSKLQERINETIKLTEGRGK